MNELKIENLLSLVVRSRKFACGFTAVENAVFSGKVRLLLVTKDAGKGLQHQVNELAEGIPVVTISTKEKMGVIFNRKPVGVVAILDPHFAAGIIKYAHE